MIEIFFNSFFVAFSGALMPGSLLTYTIDKSIKNGALTGLVISAGHALLEFLIVILLLAGLSRILTLDISRIIIGIAGGIVLLFFAFMMIKDVILNKLSFDFKSGNTGDNSSKKHILFFNGAFISVLNPYFIVWWTAVGLSLILNSFTRFGFAGVALFYSGHILADILWYTFISFFISKTRNFFNIKIYKAVIIILAAFLIFISITFFISSIAIVKTFPDD